MWRSPSSSRGAVVFGEHTRPGASQTSMEFAQFAFFELLVFFGILLVGFAYLWKRGDIEWVRGMAAPKPEPAPPPPEMPALPPARDLVATDHHH